MSAARYYDGYRFDNGWTVINYAKREYSCPAGHIQVRSTPKKLKRCFICSPMKKYYIGYEFDNGGVIVGGPIKEKSGVQWKILCPNCKTETWKYSQTLNGLKYPCKRCYDRSMRRVDDLPALKRCFTSLVGNAESRGLAVEISFDEFVLESSKPCSYCGVEPSGRPGPKKWQSKAMIHGIDRKDSSVGYTAENIASACFQCNWAKRDLTNDDWMEWLARLVAMHGNLA